MYLMIGGLLAGLATILPADSMGEHPTVDYPIHVQNSLSFPVVVHSVWMNGMIQHQSLNPCERKSLGQHPETHGLKRLFGFGDERPQLRSFIITNERRGYINAIPAGEVEWSMRTNPRQAIELLPKRQEGEFNVRRFGAQCLRLLNAYDFPVTIDLAYDDRSNKTLHADPRSFIHLGTSEIGQFDNSQMSLWQRITLADQSNALRKLVVRNGSTVLHELNRRKIESDFHHFYAGASSGEGICMSLNEEGFSFVNRCSRVIEVCRQNVCDFFSISSLADNE